MYFVKPLFFEFEPLKIANVTENGSLPSELLRFIALYEKQCLIETLGESLFKEVVDSFELIADATEFTIKASATDAIKNLVNGKTYEVEGSSLDCNCYFGEGTTRSRIWKGFVQSNQFLIGTELRVVKTSFIADYIYYHYLLVNRSISSGVGQQVLDSENSVTVMNVWKRIERYNEFVLSVLGNGSSVGLYQFLNENKGDYPTWTRNCSIRFKEKF